MSHPICDACETVANCKRNGCIPLVKQPDALEVAGRLTNGIHDAKTCDRATALLRTQHAAIERKDALLKQALSSLKESADYVREDYRTNWRHGVPTRQAQLDNLKAQVDEHEAAIDAITKELQ